MDSPASPDSVTEVIKCKDCERMVPRSNMALHQARACRGRARPPSPEAMEVDGDDDKNANANEPVAADDEEIVEVGDVINLVDDNEESNHVNDSNANDDDNNNNNNNNSNENDKWVCPRCTLLNPNASNQCDACLFQNPSRRNPDPVVRERLIVEDGAFVRQQAGSSPVGTNNTGLYMGGGAVLGGVLGAAGAYLRGAHMSSGVLQGATAGAVGGAVLQEVLQDGSRSSTPNAAAAGTQNEFSVAQARSAGVTGLPAYPSSENSGRHDLLRQRPRSSMRVVRRSTAPGVTTTVVTANGRTTRVVHRGGRGGNEDPMMEFLLQSLLASPTARARRGNMDVDNMTYDQLLQVFGTGAEHMGADETDIQALPVAKVDKELPADARQCSICLADFDTGDERKTLPCLHGFHPDCVDKWLRSNGSCPICKHRLTG